MPKKLLPFVDTGCLWTIISQCLHKALVKENPKVAMAFQQHQDFNPNMCINDSEDKIEGDIGKFSCSGCPTSVDLMSCDWQKDQLHK
uniref:Uncharacterized protein n=1 Tax=Romanomermis culicivorax TaxID=13658 RepID=A0A915JQM1_ROMCU